MTSYDGFSNYIFDELDEDEEIKLIMEKASTANDQEKEVLREDLYNKILNQYLRMHKYEYRQLHFHLPNTESFLRVHAPDKYGDLLLDVRESVRLANEYRIKVFGFEEGRISNGFRYVYPLNYNNKHLGSVEMSLSSGSIIEVLSKLYTNEDFYFIIDKVAVRKHLFDETLINYKESSIFEGYYVDKEVERISSDYNKVVVDSQESFLKGIKEKHSDKLQEKESFSENYIKNGKSYIIKFLAIENLEKIPIAYLISISESIGYDQYSKDMYQQIILLILLVAVAILLGLVLDLYQGKIKSASELDYLTNVYNRSKFYEMAKIDEKHCKRYKYDSSVMLIDIDNFKNTNDCYGHEWGDQVLKKVASEILKNIRDTDVFARWGGEEFVLLLPHTNKNEALIVAEKLRLLISESQLIELNGITISIGVSEINAEDYDVERAINLADEAMYCAKAKGRNQVCYLDDKTKL